MPKWGVQVFEEQVEIWWEPSYSVALQQEGREFNSQPRGLVWTFYWCLHFPTAVTWCVLSPQEANQARTRHLKYQTFAFFSLHMKRTT